MRHKEANVETIKTEKQLTFTGLFVSGEDECKYYKQRRRTSLFGCRKTVGSEK